MEFIEVLQRRYSCRAFAAKPVEQDKVDRMLAAENEGLATLWVGSFDPSLLAGILPDTEGYELMAMMNVGYPAAESTPSPMHQARKPMEEFVTEVKY